MTTPLIGAPDWEAEQASPWLTENRAKRMIEALARYAVIEDRDLTAPPGSCDDGACYLIAATATGDWAGQDGNMAIAVGEDAASGWYFVDIEQEGVELFVRDEDVKIRWDGAAWVNAFTGGLYHFQVAASDQITPIETLVDAVVWEQAADVSIEAVYAFVNNGADSSGEIEIDIQQDGVSILSTALTIDPAENSSRNALVPVELDGDPVNLDAGDVMSIDIVNAGDGATGLIITLEGYYR